MAEADDVHSDDAAVAVHYIIELETDGKRTFLICQPTLIIQEGDNWGGMATEEIARFIEAGCLRAAPLPGRPLQAREFRSGPGHR